MLGIFELVIKDAEMCVSTCVCIRVCTHECVCVCTHEYVYVCAMQCSVHVPLTERIMMTFHCLRPVTNLLQRLGVSSS